MVVYQTLEYSLTSYKNLLTACGTPGCMDHDGGFYW